MHYTCQGGDHKICATPFLYSKLCQYETIRDVGQLDTFDSFHSLQATHWHCCSELALKIPVFFGIGLRVIAAQTSFRHCYPFWPLFKRINLSLSLPKSAEAFFSLPHIRFFQSPLKCFLKGDPLYKHFVWALYQMNTYNKSNRFKILSCQFTMSLPLWINYVGEKLFKTKIWKLETSKIARVSFYYANGKRK